LLRGRGCLLVGGGPSLKGQIPIIRQALAQGTPAIAVNLTLLLVPAHFGVIFDFDWFAANPAQLWRFPGLIFVPEKRLRGATHYTLEPVRMRSHKPQPGRDIDIGLSDSFAEGLFSNRCGGGLGISVAWALGADPILLAGYDAQGDRHWYQPTSDNRMDDMGHVRKVLDRLADYAGERVINCSAETALTGFPRGDLETEIGRINPR